ncbi:MAG: DegT/DnrJ/EryC1/StrS family aminotransferase [Actinobacteria bacterium]|nr:DegT/DnrJ/EryC1/StrS family aminotransferase [Actinomycetota bacterium]
MSRPLRLLPAPSPLAHVRRPARRPPYPLAHPDCRLYARARHGLWHGVRALGLRPGDEVLVPAYHHGSEVEALARAGLGRRYYAGTPALEPDEAELAGLLGERVRALHLTHYLGFPQDAGRWRRWCDAHGLLLLEDAAQAWLSERDGLPAGALGDCAIWCLYKTLPLPDGGALMCRRPPTGPAGAPRWGLTSLARGHAGWLAGHWAAPGRVRRAAGTEPYDAAEDFALGDPETAVTRTTRWLLARPEADVAARRRRSYARLLERLAPFVPEPFRRVPEGASPFAFPVAVDDTAALRGALAARGVEVVDLWRVAHPSLAAGAVPAAERLRATVAVLPAHQDLGAADTTRIADAVRAATRRRP